MTARDRRPVLEEALPAAFPDAEDAVSERIEFVRAPGRVILMGGDHTEYNDGLVLAAAIGLDTWIALRRRRDGLVRIASLDAGGEPASFWIDEVEPVPGGAAGVTGGGDWPAYVAGTAWSLREAGLPVGGFDGVIDSRVPRDADLGWAASLELAAAQALLGAAPEGAAPHYPAAYLASLAQRAEREYVGVACGIVDQLAAAAARAGRAMLLDCRSLEHSHVALPPFLAVVVCDTGAPRERRDGSAPAVGERRAECARAVALLAERVPSITSLRDVDVAALRRHAAVLPEALARRVEHVVRENERVVAAAAALESGDVETLGTLFAASHASLRDDYEVGSPELDALVEIATGVPGVVGARMTGSGVGRCTVNLVRKGAAAALRRAVEREYPGRTGLQPHVYAVPVVAGAGRA